MSDFWGWYAMGFAVTTFIIILLINRKKIKALLDEEILVTPKPKNRTSRERDKLTSDECARITDDVERRKLRCPDCQGLLAHGPERGASQNFCCIDCHAEFNLVIFDEPPDGIFECIDGHRISDCGPRNLEHERASLYGLRA